MMAREDGERGLFLPDIFRGRGDSTNFYVAHIQTREIYRKKAEFCRRFDMIDIWETKLTLTTSGRRS